MSKSDYSLNDLLNVMARLRDPQTGCPWDHKQTFQSIAPYTLEEAYEVVDAIERGDMAHLEEELGDLLYQVVYHARMAEEQGLFDFSCVVNGLVKKLIRRRPHMFNNSRNLPNTRHTAEGVQQIWQAIKAKEKEQAAGAVVNTGAVVNKSVTSLLADSLLDGIPQNFPALVIAQKLQDKAAQVNFDWPDVQPVIAKIREELDEIEQAIASGNQEEIKEEVGDFLFAATNLARHLKVDAEQSVRGCNRKFRDRFFYIEQAVAASGKSMDKCSLEELDRLWDEAKRRSD